MNNLFKIQGKIMIIEVIGATVTIINCIFLSRYLGVILPSWVPGILIMMLPLISAAIRIHVWRVKEDLLTEDELKSTGATLFFLTIPIEIIFSLIAIILILSQS